MDISRKIHYYVLYIYIYIIDHEIYKNKYVLTDIRMDNMQQNASCARIIFS